MNVTLLGIVLAVFVTVTLSLVAGYEVFSRLVHRDALRVRQRLATDFAKNKDKGDQVSLFHLDRLSLNMNESAQDVKPEALLERAKVKWQALTIALEQARVSLTASEFLYLVLGLGIGFGLLATWLFGFVAGFGTAIAAAALPFMAVNYKRNARQNKLLEQLPYAFELMARVIRAGQSVPQALKSVAETFENPIAEEFSSCQHQQDHGLTPEVTFRELAQRSGTMELRIFAMAMMIHRQTGGNLSDVLDRLAGVIRARLRLRRQVQASTAEGRLQGWTLVVLPFVMFGVLMIISRRYVMTLFDHVPLLATTVVFMVIGMLWIRKIVNFKY